MLLFLSPGCKIERPLFVKRVWGANCCSPRAVMRKAGPHVPLCQRQPFLCTSTFICISRACGSLKECAVWSVFTASGTCLKRWPLCTYLRLYICCSGKTFLLFFSCVCLCVYSVFLCSLLQLLFTLSVVTVVQTNMTVFFLLSAVFLRKGLSSLGRNQLYLFGLLWKLTKCLMSWSKRQAVWGRAP